MLRPGALLEISQILYTIPVCQIKLYIIIFDWGRRYSQLLFPAIKLHTHVARVVDPNPAGSKIIGKLGSGSESVINFGSRFKSKFNLKVLSSEN
jgi:hypothetical protein